MNKNITWAKSFLGYNCVITLLVSSVLAIWNLQTAKSFILGVSSILLPSTLHAIITFYHPQTTSAEKMLKKFYLGAAVKFIFVMAFVLLVLDFFVINTSVFFIGIVFAITLYVSCSFIKTN